MIKSLKSGYILNSSFKNLSGGELQRVALIICLVVDANFYLIDEPSAYFVFNLGIIIWKIIIRYIFAKIKSTIIGNKIR